jgi:hypothetical protein
MPETKSDQYVWVSEEEARTLPEGWAIEVLRDHWWVQDEHGRLCFWRSKVEPGQLRPQANPHETIARRLAAAVPGATGIKLVPVVYRPHNCSWYR